MKVGSVLPMAHPVELNEMAIAGFAELALDSAWMADHLAGIWHPEIWPDLPPAPLMPDSDAWCDAFCLGAILGRNSDLRIATGVTDATRRGGADLARAALMLNHSCKGGFTLGIGAGEAASLTPFGYPFDRPVGKLEEALIIIRSILDTGEMPEGVGRVGIPLESDHGKPPVVVAANGPRMLKLAGRYADGWFPLGLDADEYGRRFAVVREEAERAGRPEPEGYAFMTCLFGESREAVHEALEQNPLARLSCMFSPAETWEKHGLQHPGGPDSRGFQDVIPHALDPNELRELAERIPRGLVEDFYLCGNATEVREQMQAYVDAGAQHIIIADFTAITRPPEQAMQLMGEVGKLVALLKDPVAQSERG